MEKEQIRKMIAEDLRGKPSRNPASLVPELAKQFNLEETAIWTELSQMTDAGHVSQRNETSIRLTDVGERFYFSTNKEKAASFFKTNWPYLTSNALALFALVVSIIALIRK